MQDGLDDRGVGGIAREAGYERAVDLEYVDRKVLQVRERRVARAEVVDREMDALLLELVHRGDRELCVLHQTAFGDLELEQRRPQPALPQGAAHDGAEVGLLELMRRNVDGHPKARVALLLPLGVLPAGFAEHPLPNLDDEARLLCKGQELVGR